MIPRASRWVTPELPLRTAFTTPKWGQTRGHLPRRLVAGLKE